MTTGEPGGWAFPEVQPYTDVAEPAEPGGSTAPNPPAVRLQVPRRLPAPAPPVSAPRAVAGALVAVAGVLLGIGALLWATEAPGGSPTVATGAQSSVQAPAPGASPAPAVPPAPAASPVAPAAPSAPAGTAPPPPPQVAAPPRLPLTVLNNSRITGLADRAARRFRAGGWPIRQTGNFTGTVPVTTVYYAPGQRDSAELLQRSFRGLVRVRPRFATLPGSGLTVVLTRAYRDAAG